jgi:hypothetical protein
MQERIYKVKIEEDKYGTNPFFRYIRSNPAVTFPFFTLGIFLVSYSNKWGYFHYFGISPSYLNFSFSQLLLAANTPILLFLLGILIAFYFLLSVISAIIDQINKSVKEEYNKRKTKLNSKRKVFDETYLSFLRKTYIGPLLFLIAMETIILGYNIQYLYTHPFLFTVILGVCILITCFILLLFRLYLGTLISLIIFMGILAFDFGYIKAKELENFDVIQLNGEESSIIIDYFDEKYISMKVDEFFECMEVKEPECRISINSIVNDPIEVIESKVGKMKLYEEYRN